MNEAMSPGAQRFQDALSMSMDSLFDIKGNLPDPKDVKSEEDVRMERQVEYGDHFAKTFNLRDVEEADEYSKTYIRLLKLANANKAQLIDSQKLTDSATGTILAHLEWIEYTLKIKNLVTGEVKVETADDAEVELEDNSRSTAP